MNETQYNIVKTFLTLGNSPKRIAKEFKASILSVEACAASNSYQQYRENESMSLYNRLFGNE